MITITNNIYNSLYLMKKYKIVVLIVINYYYNNIEKKGIQLIMHHTHNAYGNSSASLYKQYDRDILLAFNCLSLLKDLQKYLIK